MSQTLKRAGAMTGTVLGLGVLAAGCLTRPVVSYTPTLKTNFTDQLSNTSVDKVDILFMIDNSASMGDKQVLLADAVPDMLTRLVTPNCIDAQGNIQGSATQAGVCPAGSAVEFPPVHDMHIGIVSSSLGGRGGAGAANYNGSDECNPSADNTVVTTGLTPQHNNDKGELLNRAGEDEHSVQIAQTDNYLAWFPATAGAAGSTAPQPPVTTVGAANQYTVADTTLNPSPDDTTLIGAFQDMVVGVHEQGCGYEAQLEGWYHFLIEPNPYASIVYSSASVPIASYQGVDQTILKQRHDFLRPDSLVAVIVVTDENHSAGDPLSLDGEGWAFENTAFPYSPGWDLGYGAAEGTKVCATNPLDPGCVSCATLSTADRASQCQDQSDSGAGIYYVPIKYDIPNLRFFHERQRFGIDYHYPPSRYINALQNGIVPDQSYTGAQCTNPLFAASLPTSSTAELCKLTPNSTSGRLPGGNLVYYAAITGVPHQLIQATPGDGTCAATSAKADCPQKPLLTAADWQLIIGQDPINYNFTGVDFHMLESWAPRTQAVAQAAGAVNYSNCPPTASDTCDPINGREYDTTYLQQGYADLEYACTFQFAQPKNCDSPQYAGACDCLASAPADAGQLPPPNSGSSLCQVNPGDAGYSDTQLYGKAYPSIDELYVAQQMGQYGIVSSLCPIHTQYSQTDPLYGYRPAVNAIVDRLKAALQVSCPPHKLTLDPDSGKVDDCLVLATFNDGTTSCNETLGYSNVSSAEALADFQANQHNTWVANGQVGKDPSLELTCQLGSLTAAGGACQIPQNADPNYQGWCYVENTGTASSDAGGGCSYQILFANGGPAKDVTVSLTCVEQASIGDGG